MPTPPKPAKVIAIEGKSHRTKAELRQRERAEQALLTGKPLAESREVKENPRAHKEFVRMKKLLKSIEKNDDLYGKVINRYCLILAECIEFEEKREQTYQRSLLLKEHAGEMEFAEYVKLQNDLSKVLLSYDKQIQAKRKMLFDMEKENIMTIASALRTVPKKQEKKTNPLKEALNG